MNYKAPVEDMMFLLKDVFNIQDEMKDVTRFEDFDYDLYNAVLEEGAKFTESVLSPLNRSGDEEECQHSGSEVTTPKGFKEAYRQFCEGGWPSVNADPDFGGQGLPKALHVLFEEMLYASNTSFGLYPSLTAGAVHTVAAHASDELKATYLEKMVSGEWAGTMCLTEPHSGSDLGILKSKADPQDDGSYKLSGTKIFITGGEHDLSDNIIHLVLARLPDAPAGPRGISLFLVPKFMVNEDGSLGERNPIFCGSIEHKMGIKASSTCVMNLDDATGWLIGPPNRGLACMFTMMNKERLSISIQGIGLADMSYQVARQYAEERIQGRSAREGKQGAAIIEHADVRRMLLSMRSTTEANRALAVYLGMQNDLEEHAATEEERKAAAAQVALLTPIAKAFFTDMGYDSCNHGVQVLGGHGFIREWGVEQCVRDCRIAQIYEGTNGIQAQDLLVRKVCADKGAALNVLLETISSTLESEKSKEGLADFVATMEAGLESLKAVTDHIMKQSEDNIAASQGGAVEYLHIAGYVINGWLWIKMLGAADVLSEQAKARKFAAANFFFAHLFTKIDSLKTSIENGYNNVFDLSDELV
ncbi:acyl-CoA dehydrogenase family protein [Pleionea sp. CnH1-48]|uniref:acyl-CoA dehydrogenase family protein n=1 Tax=Pleionea sp. CnH1-48 TaxID=2954494 RepID=UPI0020968C64|nr:acyl-CoA dehydrogenase C-terminal domain-containing protein [Pleionea sp. CnH1-48]MCO7223566.1 acyl-CoA dehydrogenase C-terminal domain-containing protein [Pleionea sp. CnH1-48]